MKLRTLLIAVVLAALTAFALLNWTVFTTPTELSLGFMPVHAPLGLIMLAVTSLVIGLFLIYIVFQQAGVILEARRYAKELQAHRELADKAEASRFTDLRTFLEGEIRRLEAQATAGTRELSERMAQVERQLRDALAESTNSISAFLGEVDDKLDRALPARRNE